MRFICTKENLMLALQMSAPLTGKSVNLPILHNVLVTANESHVDIAATNLDVAVRATLRAKVEATGAFSVPAKTIADSIAFLPDGQVEVVLDGNDLSVSSGSSHAKIRGSAADEYPVIPSADEKQGYTIDAVGLKNAIIKTVVAVAKNEIRPELSGVYFGFFTDRYSGLLLAATDSYRLAEYQLPVDQGMVQSRCIVPARAALEIIRLISLSASLAEKSVRVSLGESQMTIRYGAFELITRLIDGRYPDYSQIIPSSFKTTASFPIDPMVKQIKAAGIFSSVGVSAVSFDINAEEKTIAVSSTNAQTGEYSSFVEADVQGSENSIFLNHRYVLEGLSHIDEAEADFCVNSGDAPCLFRGVKNRDYLYIVMPIRQ